jgi:Mg-chelatase subunit ChlD
MSVELTNPLALTLLILIPVALFVARRSLANLSPLRQSVTSGIRVLILLLVVLALSGLRIKTASDDLAIIFLVDVSASITPMESHNITAAINREIESASPRDYIGVIAFAREPSVELAPTRRETLGNWRIEQFSSNPARDHTNIAAALRLAAALVPESATGKLVLFSDGNETVESAAEGARYLRGTGIEIYTRSVRNLMESAGENIEVAVRNIVTPEMLSEGEAFDLSVSVDATRDTEAILRVFRNDTVVAERTVQLKSDGENVFLVPQRLDQKGFFTFRAEVEALSSDGFMQNNSRESFTLVEGRPATLYVYGDAQPSPAMVRVLSDGSFAADLRRPAAMPVTLAAFQNYDLVIFDNVPATTLVQDQMKMVQSYIKDLGGGFIMVGGENSFGPGGYFKTPIEEALPVSLDVRQKKHFPSLALALVIDKSGSMAGNKMQLALAAGSATVDFLSERDSVAVIAFDDQAHQVVGLKNVEDKAGISREIQAIQAIGGTNIFAGLEMAYQSLVTSDAQIKHIILLSDGQSDGDYDSLTRLLNEKNMTLSTVAVGEDADIALMRILAAMGGGRFYATDSADNLPKIFTQEAFLASRSTIIEEPFVPRLVRPTRATMGIDWTSAPPLGGYVGTAERDFQQTPAITSLISDKDDPIYAVWQYGLGRAAAFTSDIKARWASSWMNWSGLGQFWTQVLRDTVRSQGAVDLVSHVEMGGGNGHISVEALSVDGSFRNNLRLNARVVRPDLTSADVRLEQTAPGRYEGEFPATSRGAYLVSVVEDGGGAAPITGAVNSYSPEFGIAPGDVDLLARIAEETGGQMLSGPSEEAEPSRQLFERRIAKTRPNDIWRSLLLVALILLPVDVGTRRMRITGEQIESARNRLRVLIRRPKKGVADAELNPAMEQLKDARTRVRLTDGEQDLFELETRSEDVDEAKNIVSELQSTAVEPREESSVVKESSPDTSQKKDPLATRLLDSQRKRRQ